MCGPLGVALVINRSPGGYSSSAGRFALWVSHMITRPRDIRRIVARRFPPSLFQVSCPDEWRHTTNNPRQTALPYSEMKLCKIPPKHSPKIQFSPKASVVELDVSGNVHGAVVCRGIRCQVVVSGMPVSVPGSLWSTALC